MDKYEISVEMAKMFHGSENPRDDFQYLAKRLIECGRVYFPRDDVKLQVYISILR